MNRAWLPPEEFQSLIRLGPLVSMDLIVRDGQGRVLVGRRVNRPAQGFWFVPGGRVGKGERLDDAFLRLTETELGRAFPREGATFLGVYEHLYDDNWFGSEVGTHYVVLAYELRMAQPLPLPETQHDAFTWMTPEDLLAHPEVHPNTRAYFEGT